MKLHTSLLLAFAAQKQTEAKSFWESWNDFFGVNTDPVTVAPSVEPMPTLPPATTARAEPVQPVQPVQPVLNVNCSDKFRRCGEWRHACSNSAVAGLCQATCGLCSGKNVPVITIPVPKPVQIVEKPVPVYQPVQPVYEPVPPIQPIVQNIFCADKFSRCSLYANNCHNRAISNICAKTCGQCDGQTPVVIQKPVVQKPVLKPIYQVAAKPSEPVYQPFVPYRQVSRPVDTISMIPSKPIAPVEPVAPVVPVKPVAPVSSTQPVTSCWDKFMGCHNYKSKCSNAAIQGLCRRTCGLCGLPEPEFVVKESQNVAEVTPAATTTTVPPTTTTTSTTTTSTTMTTGTSTTKTTTTTTTTSTTTTTLSTTTSTTTEAVTSPVTEKPEINEESQIAIEDDDVAEAEEGSGNSGPDVGIPPVPVMEESVEEEEIPVVEPEPVVEEPVAEPEPVKEASGEIPTPVEFEEIEEMEPVIIEAAPLCSDFIINCAEYNNSQYRICDVRPGDEFYSMYRPIQDACRETCGFCDQNAACKALKEFCHEADVAETCPGTCAGLD